MSMCLYIYVCTYIYVNIDKQTDRRTGRSRTKERIKERTKESERERERERERGLEINVIHTLKRPNPKSLILLCRKPVASMTPLLPSRPGGIEQAGRTPGGGRNNRVKGFGHWDLRVRIN